VQSVDEEVVTYFDSYPGTVVSLEEVQLRSEITGYVTNIYFEDGEQVKKGQKLYEINPRIYRAEYNQAQANVQRAEANYQQAKRDAERFARLYEQDAIAEQRYENAQTTLESAKTELEAAKASAEVARTNLQFSSINAPISGTIGITQAELGDLVTAGQTLLNVLSQDDPIAVDVDVNEKELPGLLRLMESTDPQDSVFSLVLPDGSSYEHYGSDLLIDRAVNRQTGTIRVRIRFPNEKRDLRPGMNCNVRIRNQSNSPQMTIPYIAVTEQMSEYFVYVLGDSSKVSQRRIQLGQKINNKVVVEEGLTLQDTIAVTGIQKLKDGTQVQVKNTYGTSRNTAMSNEQ
jgi:membrane fusion protein (multidrug efflux system)